MPLKVHVPGCFWEADQTLQEICEDEKENGRKVWTHSEACLPSAPSVSYTNVNIDTGTSFPADQTNDK